MPKIKPGTLTAGMVKNDFEWKIERSVVSDNVFSFIHFFIFSFMKHQRTGNSYY